MNISDRIFMHMEGGVVYDVETLVVALQEREHLVQRGLSKLSKAGAVEVVSGDRLLKNRSYKTKQQSLFEPAKKITI